MTSRSGNDRVLSPAAFMRICVFALGLVYGFFGGLLFIAAWPAALMVGYVTGARILNACEFRDFKLSYTIWSTLGIIAGQIPGWISWAAGSTLPRPFLWMLLGPMVAGLLYVGGIGYAVLVRAVRTRPSKGATPPTSGDHGPSAQYHKHNPTPEERRNSQLRTVNV